MAKAKGVTSEDLDLLDELGVETSSEPEGMTSPREQRVIAGFEDISRFVAEHGRLPQHGENRDIFERLYAVRLEAIRQSPECLNILKDVNSGGLLDGGKPMEAEEIGDADLLAALGVSEPPGGVLSNLVHVRSQYEKRVAEEIARRNPCDDFSKFKPVFEGVQSQLKSGEREAVKYGDNATISKGDIFILEGQKVLVSEVGDWFVSDYGEKDARLRVIYDNGTESDLLMRSLRRALTQDKTSRRIKLSQGPLFAGQEQEGDIQTGRIYVLRSKSSHPFIAQHRDVIHKIGVTGGDIQSRIANADKDPTYLLAQVELVASFKLANIGRVALEALLHKFFGEARLDVELKDRFGVEVEPREWFLVPLSAIENAIEKIKEGTLDGYRYDVQTAAIVPC